jgi:soluble lytic murein transglycosylase-like protein
MPEKLEGRVLLRAGAALSLAIGTAVINGETASEETDSAQTDRVEATSFSAPIPLEVEYLETSTTTTQPTTTTTEAPPPTTTTLPPTTTTKAPPPPPAAEVSGAPAEWMAQAGIPPENYDEVDYIMTRESGWNPAARNGGGCIGLGQNCPDANGGYWLDDACPDWPNDPVCQLVRFQDYAYGRYGSWDGAAAHSRSTGWW